MTVDTATATNEAIAEADADWLRPQFCSVVDANCLNPAGFATGNGSCTNANGPRIRARCTSCGEPVCAACRTGQRGHWMCNNCSEREASWRDFEAEAAAVKAAILSA